MDTNRAPWLFVIDAVLYVLAAFVLYFLLERVFGGSLNANISLIITASGMLSAIFAVYLLHLIDKVTLIRGRFIPKHLFVASISIVFGFIVRAFISFFYNIITSTPLKSTNIGAFISLFALTILSGVVIWPFSIIPALLIVFTRILTDVGAKSRKL